MDSSYNAKQKIVIEEMKESLAKGDYTATVVESREDLENDKSFCLAAMIFLQKEVCKIISEKVVVPLRSVDPNHYYFSHDSLHTTVKNVQVLSYPPTFDEIDKQNVSELFKSIIPKQESFSFKFEDVVLFPTSISVIGYCDERLQKLVKSLGEGLKDIGVADNKKYFSDSIFFGNITVCRFTHEISEAFRQKIEELKDVSIGEVLVKKIDLVECNAVCSPKTKKIIDSFYLK